MERTLHWCALRFFFITFSSRLESHHVGLLLSHLDQKTVSSALHGAGSSGTIAGKRRRPNPLPPSSSASSLTGARKKSGVLDTSEYEFDYDTVKEKARQLAEAMPTFENEIEVSWSTRINNTRVEKPSSYSISLISLVTINIHNLSRNILTLKIRMQVSTKSTIRNTTSKQTTIEYVSLMLELTKLLFSIVPIAGKRVV